MGYIIAVWKMATKCVRAKTSTDNMDVFKWKQWISREDLWPGMSPVFTTTHQKQKYIRNSWLDVVSQFRIRQMWKSDISILGFQRNIAYWFFWKRKHNYWPILDNTFRQTESSNSGKFSTIMHSLIHVQKLSKHGLNLSL